jgi:hypothetical protein
VKTAVNGRAVHVTKPNKVSELDRLILAAALKHQSSKFILRTSTIIFVTTIMVDVLNIAAQ